jgi:hypothetical protein
MRLHATQMRRLGWKQFVKLHQYPTDINTNIRNINHPAVPYLHRLATIGIPANSSAEPWSTRKLNTLYKKGPHSSALHHFKDFLFEDFLDMIKKQYWVILPFRIVRNFVHLKLAPAGVVPQ